jgi:hypothetical protein
VSRLRIPRRRPSAAMVVACCALFVALGGTSYALAVGSIGTREIRDGSIRSIDVRDGTLSGRDLRQDSVGGDQIDEQTLDASKLDLGPGRIAVRAQIDLYGRLMRGTGVEDVDHLRSGWYEVHLDRDVSGCFPMATIMGPQISSPGMIGASIYASEPQTVKIETTGAAGAPGDQTFYLLVFC